mmetsp:Transcript_18230/g.34596  ORF Transcript_18230/g.34596 Transcript_18230/m.34596 type:complete len:261 (-) Transcript_18230:108-890(-)|eukprot:scaffold2204_cov166-Amphora_coffeaeformis.AAC.9
MNQVIRSQQLPSFHSEFRCIDDTAPETPVKEKLSLSSHERRAPRRRGSRKVSRNKSSDGLTLRSVRAPKHTSSGDFCTTRLSQIFSGVSIVTNSKKKNAPPEMAASFEAPRHMGGFLSKTSYHDESDNTSATEDLSNSSAHWVNSDIDLTEFSPPRPPRRLDLETVMENMKQAHITKINLKDKLHVFDGILDKCQVAKQELSTLMKKYEALEKLMESDGDDDIFTSGEFSEGDLRSDSNSSESYYDDEETDDDEQDFGED